MEIVIQNKLEPIIKELYNLVPSKFYLSTHFQKCCIKAGLEDDWDKAMRVAAYNRKYISIGTGFDDREDDADSAIRLTCNIAYQQGVENLLRYVVFLLDSYQSFSDQISIDTEELIDCFRIIGLTEERCQRLKKYSHNGIYIGVSFPSNLLEDTERLQSLKEEIGKAIRNHEYNKANTYSYTLLEGLLKGYLSHFNISFDKNEDIEK